MTESPKHWAAKARIEKIVLENEWEIWIRDGEDSFPFLTDLGEREYWPDLMAWKDGIGWVVFEADGKKGHWTRKDIAKMRLRDKVFLEHDIRTVRIATNDLVGLKRRSDADILEDMEWQLDASVSLEWIRRRLAGTDIVN